VEQKRIAADKDIFVLVKFGIYGNLRFLSHLEQMTMFQRACVRTGVPLAYTQGFNPHPIMSIPLPRSVGVESDGDYFCLRIEENKDDFDPQRFATEMSAQMLEGFKLNSINVSLSKKIPAPISAEYFLPLKKTLLDDNIRIKSLERAISDVLASDKLIVNRGAEEKSRRIKPVDIRSFIDDIKLGEKGVTIRCKISYGGAVRVDEIMNILSVTIDDLAGSVQRKSIEWKTE
jgi:radical SAM-linked protein